MPGRKGFGTVIEYLASTGPDVYVAIANVTRIRPFGAKVDSVDVSSQDSPDEYREKIPGFKDAGEASFDLNYDDQLASHQWLLDHVGGTVETFRIKYPIKSGAAVRKQQVFSGFITAVGPELPHDGKMSCSCVINVTSKPVFTDVAV